MLTRRSAVAAATLGGILLFSPAWTQQTAKPGEIPMPHHAHGTFTVKMGAPTPGPAEGMSRFSMTKEIHGDIEGASTGEMIAAGNPQLASAGYVAIELVTGTLDGKAGSFALQHTATMSGKALDMDIVVTPGSGTGDLKGIAGAFKINIKDGQHFYDLDYTLPEK